MWNTQLAQLRLPMNPSDQQLYVALNESLKTLKLLFQKYRSNSETITKLNAELNPESPNMDSQTGGHANPKMAQANIKTCQTRKKSLGTFPTW